MKLDRPVSRLDVDGAADAHEKRGARPSLARLRATEPHLHRFLQAKAEGLVKDLARRGVTDGATFANASDAVHSAGMVAADAVKRSREFRHSAGPAKLATGGGAGQGGPPPRVMPPVTIRCSLPTWCCFSG